jgi:hypothetical protein
LETEGCGKDSRKKHDMRRKEVDIVYSVLKFLESRKHREQCFSKKYGGSLAYKKILNCKNVAELKNTGKCMF